MRNSTSSGGFYPVVNKRKNLTAKIRVIISLSLFALVAAAIIINLCVGGVAWALYVGLSAVIFYETFLSWELVELSYTQKFLFMITAVCILLLAIQRVNGEVSGWASQIAVPLIYLGALVINFVLFCFLFRKRKQNIFPILGIIIGAFVSIILALTGVWNTRWPIIALASVSLGIILMLAVFFRKPVFSQLKKKFHI